MNSPKQSIRIQVGLLLIVTLGLSFGIALTVIHKTLNEKFLALETREAKTSVERVAEVISNEIHYPASRIGDWADWDDALEYMKTKSPKFDEGNLSQDVLNSMYLDSIRFYQFDRSLQGGVDRREGALSNLKEVLDEELPKHDEIWGGPDDAKGAAGIIKIDHRYFLYAAQGVRTTSGSGQAVGRVIFMKHLNQQFLAKVQTLLKLDMKMSFLSGPLKPDHRSAREVPLSEVPYIARASFDTRSVDTMFCRVIAFDSSQTPRVRFDFTLKREMVAQGRATTRNVAVAVCVSILICLLVLTYGLHHLVVSRLVRLTHEVSIIGSDANANGSVTTEGQNEIATLAHQINAMLSTIHEQHKAIQDIVNNVQAGFLTTDAAGRIGPGYTAHCHTLFGREKLEGEKLWDLLFTAKKDKENFECLYEQVIENLISEDLTLSQLPHLIELDQRFLKLEGAGIYDDLGIMTGVLFTLSDITHLIEVERHNSTNSALLNIIRSLNNFASFKESMRAGLEYWQSVDDISSKQVNLRRFLHTLKGNLGVYGLLEIAQLVHKIEEEPNIASERLYKIQTAIRAFLDSHAEIIGMNYAGEWKPRLIVSRSSLEDLRSKTLEASSIVEARSTTLGFVEKALSVPFKDCVKPLMDEGKRLAQRLHKNVSFALEGGELALDLELLRPMFDQLIHAVRNAIDHGIEAPEGRVRAGKPPHGCLTFSVFRGSESEWILELRDDGRGVNIEKLKAIASKQGIEPQLLEEQSHEELLKLIFIDGISTAEKTTEISGRGVGLAALKEEVERLGGTISFHSLPGYGSTLRLQWRDQAPQELILLAKIV